jgi:hypothetical protein
VIDQESVPHRPFSDVGIDPRFRLPFTSEHAAAAQKIKEEREKTGDFSLVRLLASFVPIVAEHLALSLSLLRPRRLHPLSHHSHFLALTPGPALLTPLLRLNTSTPVPTMLKLQPRHSRFPASTLGQERRTDRSLVRAMLKPQSRHSHFPASEWTPGPAFRMRTPWRSLSARREPEIAVTPWEKSVYFTATCK